ncbi:hypothetical protein GCM10027589_50500 [Actinocorallia lasiicapitis]
MLAAVLAVALVFVAAKVFHRFGQDDDSPDGPTAAHAGGMLSALFLLIFAIAVIIPWTVADSARQNTQAEAQALVEAYWDAGDLPAAQRDEVRASLRDYTRFVIDDEWPYMVAHDDTSPEGWKIADEFRARTGEYDHPDKTKAREAADGVMANIEDLFAARRQRASDASSGLPRGVLALTLVSGLIMIVYPFLAGARPRGMAWVPLTIMAAMLGVSMYLMFNINHAFSGALGVDTTAYETAQQEFTRIP